MKSHKQNITTGEKREAARSKMHLETLEPRPFLSGAGSIPDPTISTQALTFLRPQPLHTQSPSLHWA